MQRVVTRSMSKVDAKRMAYEETSEEEYRPQKAAQAKGSWACPCLRGVAETFLWAVLALNFALGLYVVFFKCSAFMEVYD